MLRIALCRSSKSYNLLFGQAIERNHVGDLRLAQGQCAGLIHQQNIRPRQGFKILSSLDEQTMLRAGAYGCKHGHRCCQGNRAGTGHDQDSRGRQGIPAE